jgi:NAD(P)-dependent dehydrogenase (short-subunit alcohol dehydrogenase family)
MSVPFTDPDLSDRVAVITGAGAGIGRAVARALDARGATVWLVGRTARTLEETAEPMARAVVHAADVAEQGAMERLADAVRDAHGALHILINNAAILGPVAALPDYPRQAFDDVMRINVSGTFAPTQALLPLLRAGKPSVVINLSSGVGRRGRANWGAYAASKFAVEGLTQVWADELRGQGVSVNAVNPGGTRTAMRAAAKPGEDPSTLPTPDDVVASFLWLLSPEAHAMGVSGVSIDARDYM